MGHLSITVQTVLIHVICVHPIDTELHEYVCLYREHANNMITISIYIVYIKYDTHHDDTILWEGASVVDPR